MGAAKMRKKKVAVAMSGGVDSSVAAAILIERGFEVIGVTMRLFDLPQEYCRDERLRSCCGRKAVQDAHSVAISLSVPHYVADFRRSFENEIISDFCQEYSRGRTPNPCIRCNERIKFDLLHRKAVKLGAEYIATGHHARVEYDRKRGRYLLKKGKDKNKDQSYFLYTLTQDQLSRTLFPIGCLTKKAVRKKAEDLHLPVSRRPESQEICFIPDDDYVRFLKGRIPGAFLPGPILDTKGRLLGTHQGIIHYTIGQRKGMGIAASQPLYVLRIDSENNAVIAGPDEELKKKELIASDLNWISIKGLDGPIKAKARIRYKHREAAAWVSPLENGRASVRFSRKQRAITPGQAVVFYDGEIVVGGGTIECSRPRNS
jgi:tRNA-specific 2-thiouridylase